MTLLTGQLWKHGKTNIKSSLRHHMSSHAQTRVGYGTCCSKLNLRTCVLTELIDPLGAR